MGHLVNANALRVGWFRNWTDTWYTDHVYYAEFLHMIFRVRLYLNSFIAHKNIESMGYFYSHFEILHKSNVLRVNLFIYDGATEKLINHYFMEHAQAVRQFNSEPWKRKSKRLTAFWNIWVLMSVTFGLNIDPKYWGPERFRTVRRLMRRWDNRLYGYLVYRFATTRYYREGDGDKRWYFIRETYRNMAKIAFFLKTFKETKIAMARMFLKKKAKRNLVLGRFLNMLLWQYWTRAIFNAMRLHFIYVLSALTHFNAVDIGFFAFTNHNVNARFLSRFIARRLKQGVSVKAILYPLKKELHKVSFLTRHPSSSYMYALRKNEFEQKKGVLFRQTFFQFFVVFLTKLYSKFYSIYYEHVGSWLFFDLLSVLPLLHNYFFIRTHQSTARKITQVTKAYVKNRVSLGYVFFAGKKYLGTEQNTLYLGQSRIRLHKRKNVYSFIDFLFNDLYSNLNLLLSDIKKHFFYDVNFFLSNYHLNKTFTYGYWKYNYAHYHAYAINRRNLRTHTPIRESGLYGFKFHCLGRFSRKERASSIWHRENKVPLNTLSANIDYAFFTIALRNSSATVKVWLYRNNDAHDFYFRII